MRVLPLPYNGRWNPIPSNSTQSESVTGGTFSITKFTPPTPSSPGSQGSKGPQLLTDKIRATEVRLIDGEENSIVPREQAIQMAQQRGLDLIVMSLDSAPPVVRMVDFGKFKFEAEKKAREAKKKQHVVEVKEIKMGIRIDQHDYQVKLSHAVKFLQAGNKVKGTIRLKGREVQHTNLAFDLANRFIVDLENYGTQEGQFRLEGKTITINISPIKQQSKSAGDKEHHAQDENA